MTMHEIHAWLVFSRLGSLMALLAGAALGLVFYASLWWTVRRVASFRRPGLSVLLSLLLRMSVTLGGFYLVLVSGADWLRLLLCLAGFVLARVAVTWHTRMPPVAQRSVMAATGASHAP